MACGQYGLPLHDYKHNHVGGKTIFATVHLGQDHISCVCVSCRKLSHSVVTKALYTLLLFMADDHSWLMFFDTHEHEPTLPVFMACVTGRVYGCQKRQPWTRPWMRVVCTWPYTAYLTAVPDMGFHYGWCGCDWYGLCSVWMQLIMKGTAGSLPVLYLFLYMTAISVY